MFMYELFKPLGLKGSQSNIKTRGVSVPPQANIPNS